MKPFSYYNPVQIKLGQGSIHYLGQYIGKRRTLLLTSEGFTKRGLVEQLCSQHQQIQQVIDEIPANPTISALKKIYEKINHHEIDVIVALGGGSVIDAAKVLSVYFEENSFEMVEGLIKLGDLESQKYSLVPIIAIPTTAGTGSEVTPWATVWDSEEKVKYSLHLKDLWCEVCICDPELTLTLPREITIHTGLDALSHSLESLWNKNANPISTAHAIYASREILDVLPLLVDDLENIQLRERMMFAALKAGLAFSNTQTAIAHALSYYLTLQKGVPHGIACSFSLPAIVESQINTNPEIANILDEIIGRGKLNKLSELLKRLDVSMNIFDYGLDKVEVLELQRSVLNVSRAKNSLVDINDLFNRLSC